MNSSETPEDWRFQKYTSSPPPPKAFSQWGLPLGLFLITAFTTLWAGAYQLRPDLHLGAWDFLIKYPENLIRGIPFAGTLLAILVTHEFGHYIFFKDPPSSHLPALIYSRPSAFYWDVWGDYSNANSNYESPGFI